MILITIFVTNKSESAIKEALSSFQFCIIGQLIYFCINFCGCGFFRRKNTFLGRHWYHLGVIVGIITHVRGCHHIAMGTLSRLK